MFVLWVMYLLAAIHDLTSLASHFHLFPKTWKRLELEPQTTTSCQVEKTSCEKRVWQKRVELDRDIESYLSLLDTELINQGQGQTPGSEVSTPLWTLTPPSDASLQVAPDYTISAITETVVLIYLQLCRQVFWTSLTRQIAVIRVKETLLVRAVHHLQKHVVTGSTASD